MTGNTDTHTTLTPSPPGISDPPTACSQKKKRHTNTALIQPPRSLLADCYWMQRGKAELWCHSCSTPLFWLCGVRMDAATQTHMQKPMQIYSRGRRSAILEMTDDGQTKRPRPLYSGCLMSVMSSQYTRFALFIKRNFWELEAIFKIRLQTKNMTMINCYRGLINILYRCH